MDLTPVPSEACGPSGREVGCGDPETCKLDERACKRAERRRPGARAAERVVDAPCADEERACKCAGARARLARLQDDEEFEVEVADVGGRLRLRNLSNMEEEGG